MRERTSVSGLPADHRFVDEDGRERLLRGINVVYKDAPWLPTATEFNANSIWVAADAKLLASLGFNLIRLGVMWPGVMPDNVDEVNMTYIAEIKKLVAIAAAEGIYTIVEPHQDESNPRFCGEGAPNWWVVEHTRVDDFPIPVRAEPFPVDPSRPCPGLHPEQCPGVDFPGRQLCDMNSSFSYIWTHAGSKAYQTLWENAEAFAAFWKVLAREFMGMPEVIGGELWNEPFPGDVFDKPEFRDNHHADEVNLLPFYTNVTKAIREAAPDQRSFAVAYEPTWPVGDQDLNASSLLPSTSGFSKLPESNAVYAFHWYVPPADAKLSRYIDLRVKDAMRLGAVPFASEWNFGAGDQKSAAVFADWRRVAYTGWQYKTYQAAIPGGTCTGCGSAFFEPDGRAIKWTFEGMRAPFAQAVAGRVISIRSTPFDTPRTERGYSIAFVSDPLHPVTAPTEIVVSTMWLTKDELDVEVKGQGRYEVTMQEMAGARLTDGVAYMPWTRISVVVNTATAVLTTTDTATSITIRAKPSTATASIRQLFV